MKKMIMAEFTGKKHAGYFRLKPVYKVGAGATCPRCGSLTHIGVTTCEVKTLNNKWWYDAEAKRGNHIAGVGKLVCQAVSLLIGLLAGVAVWYMICVAFFAGV